MSHWKYLLVVTTMVFSIFIVTISGNAETEDAAHIEYENKYYHEPIWESRYGTSFNFDESDRGTAVVYDCDKDANGVVGDESSNIGIIEKVIGNGVMVSGQDYGSMKATSHKIFIPKTQSPFSYTITLSADYRCDYWSTSTSMICRSYFRIIGYDSSNNVVSQSSVNYVVRYDTFNSYTTAPDDDGDLHSAGSTTYSITNDGISYIKIIFVTEGSWLYSVDGVKILYTNIDLKYNLFAGTEYSKGDSAVTLGKYCPTGGLVKLELRNGAANGNDYGTVKARTPFLYFNNEHSTLKNYVGNFQIDYNREYWNTAGSMVYRGYFKVHYYDASRSLLGTDTNQFIDYNTVTAPNKYVAPQSSGTLSIGNPSEFNAKYIQIELILTGSWLHSSNGARIEFTNLKIAGGGGYNIELLFYYQSDYDSASDLPDAYYYLMNYELTENYDSRLFLFRDEIDDAVDRSDFDGTNNDDVRSNDFVIHSGHGVQGLWDTYLSLTRNQNVDDDDIGNWGSETEIVFLYACEILGNADIGGQQRAEWAKSGLYKNHAILGFTDVSWDDFSTYQDFIDELTSGTTFALAFERAFSAQPWASIWDTSWQANSDQLWDVETNSNSWSSDESSNDSTYYVRLK